MTEGIWSEGGIVGSVVMNHLVHAARHLGMLECLLARHRFEGCEFIFRTVS